MKAAVLRKVQGIKQQEGGRRGRGGQPTRTGGKLFSFPSIDFSSALAKKAPNSTSKDGRAGLMSRQAGNLNVWKAPVEGPVLRYAKRCSRSPSPIPRRKVSFRLSAVGSSSSLLLPSLADAEGHHGSISTFNDSASSAGLLAQHSDHTAGSMTESSSSLSSSAKSSLKVARQSVSVVRTYDPTVILQEDLEKRVKFASVSVHLHPMTLGDNPSVSAGIPVQIDWKPSSSVTRPLDEYEAAKGHRPPRSVEQLRIGPTRRENLLKHNGEDRGDMLRVLRSVALIQASREKNAGIVSVDRASSSSSSSQSGPAAAGEAPASQRIRSGTPLPKAFQRFVVSKPGAQPAA